MGNSVVITATADCQITNHINSTPPSATYMRQWIGSALVQIMACHLFGAKPLSEGVLEVDP